MASGCLAKVVFSDARHNFLLYGLAAVGVLLFTPVIFGLSGLNARMAAQPMEIVSAVIGTILMTPVFMPEQNETLNRHREHTAPFIERTENVDMSELYRTFLTHVPSGGRILDPGCGAARPNIHLTQKRRHA